MPGLFIFDTPAADQVANLRTINFSKLVDRDSAEAQKLVLACQEVGFFYLDLTDPGSKDLLLNKQEAVAISKAHGYKPVGLHAGIGTENRDGWEALKIGRQELQSRWALAPLVRTHIRLFDDLMAESHFVLKTILECISSALGLRGTKSLQNYHCDDKPTKSSLFFNHYPPRSDESGSIGQNMHTDLGSLTLLFAPQWGLQALCPNTPSLSTNRMAWQFVEPRLDHAVINVGDTLRFLTGNKLRSALHRAMPLRNEDRYSLAYFLRASDDAEFVDPNGNVVEAVDWYLRKNKTYEQEGAKQLEGRVLVGGLENELPEPKVLKSDGAQLNYS
ncbi:2og-fe oxygenase family protein [Venturia nashicola]|uniref:2og-fe oxygenase family protein n=1 Tax=Venturia nashicola TaxID=86259 RepID=A0A4Z1NY07_9PEZI|nr:2og-fe oxygenase family protein [Venturia nashicola]